MQGGLVKIAGKRGLAAGKAHAPSFVALQGRLHHKTAARDGGAAGDDMVTNIIPKACGDAENPARDGA
ncbi:MAG: hypothetical protein A3D16_01780 [Rhodobacterales bacterium RIFCSPHIGHO2_02_FULL_62_130]|nr:MAG: hypothetical protein A3D16_01780 [Rhodobacterales bacterium RIFCSPHIGHO2_02_FULL_62_130]OHC55175.1 MAG: hypothetical protein A3E48_11425 [Rhodobacterales bacterium RIFCSPHIGHO2_12_FULL_62_75]HCZ00492.1 hypothetical protein [Rhodobacter sp.]